MRYQFVKAISSLPPAGEPVNLRFTKGSWLIVMILPSAPLPEPTPTEAALGAFTETKHIKPAARIVGSAPTCPEAIRICAQLKARAPEDAPALRALAVGAAAREYTLHT